MTAPSGTLDQSPRQASRIGRVVYLELVVLLLSLFSLGSLAIELFFDLSAPTRMLLGDLDFGICLVFLADFFIHLWLAPSKKKFLEWGWIDFISSIPSISFLRWGRIFRVVRILRAFRTARALLEEFSVDPVKGTLALVALTTVASLLFATVAVLQVETAPNSNIRTPGDALWWAFGTVTTIGYGDRYPITVFGRMVAVALAVCGVSLFGTVTAYVSSFFVLKNRRQDKIDAAILLGEIRALSARIESLEDSLRRQTKDSGAVTRNADPNPR